MILNLVEIMEVKHWDKIEMEDGGIALGITLYNDQWHKYILNERELWLFNHGFRPEVTLRTYTKDNTPEIVVNYWKHYGE